MRKLDEETLRSDSEKPYAAADVLYVSPDGSIEDMRSILTKTLREDLLGNDPSTLLLRRMLRLYLDEDSFEEGDEELMDEIVQGVCGRRDWVREDVPEAVWSFFSAGIGGADGFPLLLRYPLFAETRLRYSFRIHNRNISPF